MTAPAYINARQLAQEWGVSRDYIRDALHRADDPLPLSLLPGKARNPVGLVEEVEAWRRRNG